MRPTRELILLVLAVTVGAVIVAGVVGLLLIELVHPETDTTAGLATVWNIAGVILGGLIGYVVGRRNNGNGTHT